MTAEKARTVVELLQIGEDSAPALLAPDRSALDHGGLRRQVEATAARLAGFGIGRGDAVGIVLPNGPEMASAFLGVAAAAVAAPLNPAYRADEYAFYLDDLEARAIILLAGEDSPARDIARDRKLPILNLVPGSAAGEFSLQPCEGGADRPPSDAARYGAPDDAALVLHTSGTTSRPKIVPLSQANLAASARHIGETLRLGPGDRCLNIMPLFHIHGLIAATLSSLAAGGSIYCAPGFNALKVFGWIGDARPSWITAVPTMHQAILARAERNREIIDAVPLRFIRSSSAALPVPVFHALEETFGCPVIESYGMTEATHQMASNQLPPGKRKPGTVGAAAGPEIAVMDQAGNLLAQGETGEIVIRGPNVTAGYQNNPKANAENFTHGWFRTGDQGALDEDGFLTISGRLKEIINRGGEKIAPREVDDVLLEHPAVAQAVTFAMPHDKLGEDVAAVIVLNEGAEAAERDLRDFAARSLADFKVPRRILFMDEIPKGATGKLQRIGLAEKLGLV